MNLSRVVLQPSTYSRRPELPSMMQDASQKRFIVSISVCVPLVLLLVYGQVMYGGPTTFVIPVPLSLQPKTNNVTSDDKMSNGHLGNQSGDHRKSAIPAPSTNDDKPYLSIAAQGRLGNQMFEYAALRGIAHRNNRIPVINPREFRRLLSPFNINITKNNGKLHNSTTVKGFLENVTLSLSIVKDLPKKNISLWGYYQSYYFFENVVEDIRRDFAFKSHIKQNALDILNTARPSGWRNGAFIQVGIHVRRTDLITKHWQKDGFIFPKMSYFKNAMNYFIANHSHVQFMVASDDIRWCQQHLNITKPGVDVHFLSGNSPAVDMAVLSSCDHMIITSGTFGWWAAWLCKGQIIRNKNFPVKNTKGWRWRRIGYYRPSWIALE